MTDASSHQPAPARWPLPSFPVRALLQPVLRRVVHRVARRHPGMFARIAPYQQADFIILAHELPFALHLRPDPDAPVFRAIPRDPLPEHDARIEGAFMLLLRLMDGEDDGDAAFFSRDLTITGNTEAVVSLRNALDDVDGSIAQDTANLFGPPGRMVLDALRRRATK